jgi:hypothetical protein
MPQKMLQRWTLFLRYRSGMFEFHHSEVYSILLKRQTVNQLIGLHSVGSL